MKEVDYECEVDIVTEKRFDLYLLIVIRFPNNILTNCHLNPDAFTLYNQDQCLRLCDHLYADSPRSMSTYFTASLKGKMRFRFVSNCSINSEMNANLYEVTATSARIKGNKHCNLSNESLCIMGNIHYCFTSGVACDGIKNCGVSDWFDERRSECGLASEILGYTPVLAVCGAVTCMLLAATHVVRQCLSPPTNSFFIFNANEDNRLCVDTVLRPPDEDPPQEEQSKRTTSPSITTLSS
ncbi:uncharacterized protein LOC113227931 isoform X3 [Hyposmocoma kahamanoa]|nr:uncharacterized protein LOC113227931 isoform X3 [Hyposmocoma kahamanoa]XP_026316843.1 uncharacterized protein LOC113227931 isoform X3 [Hyposmocoma kahamanoa]